jgi:methyl-accepting chemotaxis protein
MDSQKMTIRTPFKLSSQLYLIVVGLLLCGAALSMLSLDGMSDSNAGLQTVFHDRVEPLKGLKIVADMYAVNIVDTAHKARNQNIDYREALDLVDQAKKEIDDQWQAYLSTTLVEEEKKLVTRANSQLASANSAIAELRNILERKDAAALALFTAKDLYPAIDPVSDTISKLIEVQVVVARHEYDAATAGYTKRRTTVLIALLVSFAAAMAIAWRVIGGVSRRLGGEPGAVRDIASRISAEEFNFEVPVRKGDTKSAMVALREMKDSLHNLKLNAEGQIAAIQRSQLVIELGLDGIILDANESFSKVLGYSRAQLVGRPLDQFSAGVERDSTSRQLSWEQLRRGNFDSGVYQFVNHEGQKVWINGSFNPIFDLNGKPFKIVAFATDITMRRQETRMNAAFKSALDNVGASVMVADMEFNIIYMNESTRRMMTDGESDFRKDLPNFNAKQLVGANIDVFHRNPAHQRQMLAHLDRPVTAQMMLGGRSLRIVASPMVAEGGERVGTVVEWRDLTQEVMVESEVETIVDEALKGNLSTRLRLEGKQGFFSKLSIGVNELVSSLESVVDEVKAMVSAANNGDLTRRIETTGKTGLMAQIGQHVNELIENMAGVVSEVTSSTSQISVGAGQISQGNASLSQRTEEQASSLEETAATMEQMTSTVRQNADNAGQANLLAATAREQAETGGAVVSKAVAAMTAINQSSRQIADIIGVIDDIAFQTNLLALNAAVEAARAGEQGRGFAIVASEVRNLAGRSAKAAKEIETLIQDSVKKVNEGSELVTQSGVVLEQIVGSVKKVSDIVAEIAAAGVEQSSGIEQVNKAVMQLDELTQQNAALVEQVSAASHSMAEQARTLDTSMQRYVVASTRKSFASRAKAA